MVERNAFCLVLKNSCNFCTKAFKTCFARLYILNVDRSPSFSFLVDLTGGGGAGGRGAPRGGMGRGRGRGYGGRDMTLISQTVRISQGPYKGIFCL